MTEPATITFEERILLSRYSNFKIGGEARYFFEAKITEELAEALRIAKERGLRVFILGGGTNLLISDEGFSGLVVKPAFTKIEIAGITITAGAGVLMSDLLNIATEHGLAGLEWAGGLPGTVGGAVRGNAGCFGGETKDAITEVTSFDPQTMSIRTRGNKDCAFGYRMSAWKGGAKGEIVTKAVFTLRQDDPETIKKSIREKIDYRAARHPLEYPNIGSIFKNVPVENIPEHARECFSLVVKTDPFPVVPAAYLISEAGLKETTAGGAMISPKHPNFIVNTGRARAKDVEELIRKMKDAVSETFSISLDEEIERVE